jgi:hypothetical protein
MRRKPVPSETIASVGYSGPERLMEVEFVGGEVYRYRGVPRREHDRMLAAPSIGAYFNRHVRDRYPTERLGRAAPADP